MTITYETLKLDYITPLIPLPILLSFFMIFVYIEI